MGQQLVKRPSDTLNWEINKRKRKTVNQNLLFHYHNQQTYQDKITNVVNY